MEHLVTLVKLYIYAQSLNIAEATSTSVKALHRADLTKMPRGTESEPCTSSDLHTPAKQLRLYQCRSNTVSQKTVDRLILNFITEGLQPFSVVNLHAFKELVTNLRPGKTYVSRNCRLKNHATDMKRNLRIVLESVNTVATTTDCWSARGKSYIGVTVHWINNDNMERISAALACQRLTGSHTYDVLAGALESIHNEYGIGNKISKTTTDNGSNFVKAFSVFGNDNITNTDEIDVNNEDDDDEFSNEEDISDDVIYHNITNHLDEGTEDEDYDLPSHQRCACHTLQLIATGDADQAEENAAYKRLSQATFSKCQALWNKSSRSVLAAEAVQSNCGMALVKPNKTRWNSVYMAVERLVRIIKQKEEGSLHSLCKELKVPR